MDKLEADLLRRFAANLGRFNDTLQELLAMKGNDALKPEKLKELEAIGKELSTLEKPRE